jgi:hypothetical protein
MIVMSDVEIVETIVGCVDMTEVSFELVEVEPDMASRSIDVVMIEVCRHDGRMLI